MSGLMSAIGRGISRAAGAAADLYARQILAEEESQRQMRLLEYKAQFEDKLRQQRSERISSKAGEMIEKENEGLMTAKRERVESGIVDRESWTPEQQAAVDQSMELDREKLKGRSPDGLMLSKAAVATGDLEPEKLAELERKGSADIYKAMWEQAKEEGRDRRSDERLQYLFAALGAKGGKGESAREALSYLDNVRKELQSEEQHLRQLYLAEIKDKPKAKVEAIKAEYQPKFESINERRAMIEEDFEALRDRVGLPVRGAKKPDAAAPSSAPTPKEPQQAMPLPKSKDQLKVGEWYETSRGRARWNGTAFEK